MTGGRVAVVVLAGGSGRRIGGDKPRRRLGSQTLLQHAAARARSWSAWTAIAGGQADEPGMVLIDDVGGFEGPLAGLAAALRFARAEGADSVLTLACDTPFVPDDLVERLAVALREGGAAAVPVSGGRLHPACALWRADLGPALTAYARDGGRSLTGFAQTVGHASVVWPDEPVDPFFNINTPEDLAVAGARLELPL